MLRDYHEAPELAAPSQPMGLDGRCRSLLCSAVGVVGVLFAGSWLFTSGLVLDARTLAAAGFSAYYARQQTLQLVYFPATYTFEVLVLFCGGAASLAVCFRPSKARSKVLNLACWTLVVTSVVFLGLLIAANVDAPREKKSVQAGEVEFGKAFNAFYCDLRATQLCVDADGGSTLLTMFSTSSTWTYCRPLVVSHGGAITAVQSDFLLSCNSTEALDAWCGEFIASGNSSGASSPFAVNPGKLHAFENEWPSRVHLDSIYLGIVLLCVGVLCALMWPLKDVGCGGFVVVETKTPGPAKSNAVDGDTGLMELARRF